MRAGAGSRGGGDGERSPGWGGGARREAGRDGRRGGTPDGPFCLCPGCSRRSRPLSPPPSRPPRRERSSAGSGTAASGRVAAEALRGAPAIHPAANMATGGYRSAGGSTTDFLEEWKAKREKMRAKQAPTGQGAAAAGAEARPAASSAPAEPHHHLPAALPPERGAPPAGGAANCLGPGRAAPGKDPPPQGPAAGREPGKQPPAAAAAPGSPEGEEKPAAKGKSSGPSARKGKGQIEKRKLREKRRSTGVVNIPAAEVSGAAGPGAAVAAVRGALPERERGAAGQRRYAAGAAAGTERSHGFGWVLRCK